MLIENKFIQFTRKDDLHTRKAFDKVCHKILINKLSKLGISGKLLCWIKNYLSKRILTVCINEHLSYEFEATSGVPQGSHLGPILFILFINDVTSIFSDVNILLFADDMKIYKIIKNIYDCLSLQSNFMKFAEWCTINKLTLNIKKCQIMSFFRIKNPIKYSYTLNNHSLLSVSEIRDLGITFDTKLSFINHINMITSKAMKMLGFIIRISKDFKNIHTLKLLYTTLVRSHLEYNSSIWNPFYKSHAISIERIQHKFIRIINFKLGIPADNIDYNSLLQTLRLLSLKDRRIINDLIFLFKIINNRFDSPELVSLINYHVPSRPTRLKSIYHCNNTGTNSEQNSILHRLHRLGNEYCNIDASRGTLFSYKECLKRDFVSVHSHM